MHFEVERVVDGVVELAWFAALTERDVTGDGRRVEATSELTQQ